MLTNSAKRVADTIVHTLISSNINHFFGVPGGPISPIFDAILGNTTATLIESRQETGAAFAAGGYNRISGHVPCVMVTAGPGATNVVTGVTAAYLEHTPMIVLAGDVSWTKGGRMLQDSGPQGIDMEGMFRGVTKATIRIRQAKSAAAHVMAAIQIATNPNNPGPVLIVIAIEVASELEVTPETQMMACYLDYRISQATVEMIRDKIINAERPLLVLGAGCRPFAQSLETLLSIFKVPFVTTPRGKGVVSESHSCSLRHGGLAASMWAREYCQRGVDFALVLGTDLDDCSIGPTKYIREGGELVHVDLDSTVFNRNLPTTLGLVTNVGSLLNQLIVATFDMAINLKDEVREIKSHSAFDVWDFETQPSVIITPYRAIFDLQTACPDARFVTDIGEHMLFALHYLTATNPQQFTIHLGLGSMGSGICSAIGMAIADRGTGVICICGDGGMQMNGMEVITAKMQRLPILFAIFNDSRYNMVYHGYKQVYGKETPVETPLIDFRSWGLSMGIASERINHSGEITPNLIGALMHDGPAILDIRIDRNFHIAGGGRNEALQLMSQPEK
ncbi:thiamine pyrophosphate-binding protein [Candidatus Pacearchaeota archaeon]|jgi:acetolactate synthase-1/2/3 large subunit|nr:thiamine pyrophosphate-binding protein [Candidatus Pacearchaeota archaeon]